MSSAASALVQRLGIDGLSAGPAEANEKRASRPTLCVPGLSKAFPAGLPLSLHVMEGRGVGDAASLGALALAIASHTGDACATPQPDAPARTDRGQNIAAKGAGTIAWITESLAASEGGAPYAPGLAASGHEPSALLMVEARRGVDALWAAEECLRSRAVAAVIVELFGQKALTLTASQRLALRAEETGVPAFVLSQSPLSEGGLAARSRWQVSAAPSRAVSDHSTLIGPPCLEAHIVKNRDGPVTRLDLTIGPNGTLRATSTTSTARPHQPAPSPLPVAGPRADGLIAPAVLRLAAARNRRHAAAMMRS